MTCSKSACSFHSRRERRLFSEDMFPAILHGQWESKPVSNYVRSGGMQPAVNTAVYRRGGAICPSLRHGSQRT